MANQKYIFHETKLDESGNRVQYFKLLYCVGKDTSHFRSYKERYFFAPVSLLGTAYDNRPLQEVPCNKMVYDVLAYCRKHNFKFSIAQSTPIREINGMLYEYWIDVCDGEAMQLKLCFGEYIGPHVDYTLDDNELEELHQRRLTDSGELFYYPTYRNPKAA